MTESLQELLLSIAVGEPIEPRAHEGIVVFCSWCGLDPGRHRDGDCGGPACWRRDLARCEQEPGRHPGLWEELQTTVARLSKMSGSSGTAAKAAELPMPFHSRASAVAHQLANEVTTWARIVAEENPHLTLSARSVPAAARWLAALPTILAEHSAAVEIERGIRRAVHAAEQVIDYGPDRVWAGPCYEPTTEEAAAALNRDPGAEITDRCLTDLFARKGKDFVLCRGCGAEHAVADRRAWIGRSLGTLVVSAAEAAPVLSWILDKDIKVQTIFNWRSKGRIAPVREQADDDEVQDRRVFFRFSELEALAREVKPRNTQQRSTRRVPEPVTSQRHQIA